LALYDSLADVRGRIIGVHGSAGGGRDIARRGEIGRIAAEHEDIVIVTNEDPYEDDPRTIIEAVAQGATRDELGERKKVEGASLFLIDDRAQAIEYAIGLAKPDDVVLITGKGSEPVMAVKGGSIPWDDRAVVRSSLARHGWHV
jgi:UDP-N-acetylmuramoyl-L-alanyl-D-glutamate--2,6-diaminopimelate ligase